MLTDYGIVAGFAGGVFLGAVAGVLVGAMGVADLSEPRKPPADPDSCRDRAYVHHERCLGTVRSKENCARDLQRELAICREAFGATECWEGVAQ